MYNSSIKKQGEKVRFKIHQEIPGKVFYNDMSKTYMREEFRDCDVIYSEISWAYGYNLFNEAANNSPAEYGTYLDNINKLIHELGIPAFIVCGKNAARHFTDYTTLPIAITTAGTNMSGCQLYVFNYDKLLIKCDKTAELVKYLALNFNKCLDFSCGYGEHLLKFKDFIACDIDKDCLTYVSILVKELIYGKTKNRDRQRTV